MTKVDVNFVGRSYQIFPTYHLINLRNKNSDEIRKVENFDTKSLYMSEFVMCIYCDLYLISVVRI